MEYCHVEFYESHDTLAVVLQMRLNKVSELIHNSTNHQNLDKASVSVHFQEIIDLVIVTFLLLSFHAKYNFCVSNKLA